MAVAVAGTLHSYGQACSCVRSVVAAVALVVRRTQAGLVGPGEVLQVFRAWPVVAPVPVTSGREAGAAREVSEASADQEATGVSAHKT